MENVDKHKEKTRNDEANFDFDRFSIFFVVTDVPFKTLFSLVK